MYYFLSRQFLISECSNYMIQRQPNNLPASSIHLNFRGCFVEWLTIEMEMWWFCLFLFLFNWKCVKNTSVSLVPYWLRMDQKKNEKNIKNNTHIPNTLRSWVKTCRQRLTYGVVWPIDAGLLHLGSKWYHSQLAAEHVEYLKFLGVSPACGFPRNSIQNYIYFKTSL